MKADSYSTMQHIDRQKLVIFISIGVALLLAVIVILVSIFTNPNGEKEEQPTPKPTQQVTENPDENIDPPAVGDSDDEDAPPVDMYDNDYSNDEGYAPLGEGFNPETNALEGTVYDDEFVYFTHSRLMCELAGKQISTEKALQPLKDFVFDLSFNGSPLAATSRKTAEQEIKWYGDRLGERVGKAKQEELSLLYCQQSEIDLYLDPDDHEH